MPNQCSGCGHKCNLDSPGCERGKIFAKTGVLPERNVSADHDRYHNSHHGRHSHHEHHGYCPEYNGAQAEHTGTAAGEEKHE